MSIQLPAFRPQCRGAIRGISADELFIDEFQDLAVGSLEVLNETLSYATAPRTVLCGTSKMLDNALESNFAESTGCEWQVPCIACGQSTPLDERTIGATSLICPTCAAPIDARLGRWIPRNPTSTWGAGFSINHLMVPWINIRDILERQRSYDPVRFRNECLGLPVSLDDHIITREEIERCCRPQPFARTRSDVPAAFRQRLVAGIDWGGDSRSGTVLVIGYVERDLTFASSAWTDGCLTRTQTWSFVKSVNCADNSILRGSPPTARKWQRL